MKTPLAEGENLDSNAPSSPAGRKNPYIQNRDRSMARKLGRNDHCSCGSGKKYKHCCMTGTRSNTVTTSPVAVAQATRMAWMYYQSGFPEQAELVCRQLIDTLPKYAEAWHLLGVLALKDGNTELALHHLLKAVGLGPQNQVLQGNLGLAFHEHGELNKAEACYRKAISIDPHYADVYYNLHAVLLDHQDQSETIHCLRTLLAITPHDMDARLMLGILLDRKGDEEPDDVFEAIRRGPADLQARLDAWEYIRSKGGKTLPMLGSNKSTFKLALEAARLDGLVMEFGVRHGNTLRQIASLAAQEAHGFDSFEGLPEVWHHEPKGSYTTKGVIPVMPENVELHVGWFETTLPEFLKFHKQPVRFINIDCDIYSSTRTVLDLLAPQIVSGTVIVFDEYIGNEHWREDEFKAFQEAVAENGWKYEYLSFSMFTKQVTVRIL